MKEYNCSVSAVIFNNEKKMLLVSENGTTNWQVVTGWLEDDDVQDGMKREIKEELGPFDFRIYDVIDAHTFHHENKNILSVWYLVKYIDGDIKPSDDIQDFKLDWFDFDELKTLDISCPMQFEIIEKAFFLFDKYETNTNLNFLKCNQKS